MTESMLRRGPDDDGMVLDGDVGLGARRLAIIDPSGSRQPLTDETGRIQVVVNGEIYNFRALRRELTRRGHRLVSDGDGEVIAHLYEEMGIDLVHRLRGMFAFALYDRERATLFLARDPFGIKPLFLAEGRHGGLLFASDVAALVASGEVAADVDPGALWDYLTFQYVPGERTMLARVRRLPPGSYAAVRGGEARVVRYTEPDFDPDDGLELAEAAASVRAAVEESVRLHLESDVPVGAFLSSGVDSSAVVALMRRELGRVDTFSIAFSGAADDHNELGGAGEVARALGTRHHELVVTPERYAEAWPEIVRAMEDPVADPSAPGIYFLSEEAARHVRVVLSGEGADELFGGYPVYRQPHDLRAIAALPAPLGRAALALARRLPPGQRGRNFVERARTPLERRYLGGARLLEEDVKATLVRADALGDLPPRPSVERAASWYASTRHLDAPTRMQSVDLRGWLAGDILVKADKMSMAHSLELRVPYLDAAVYRVARRLPTRLKLARNTTKLVLREAVKDLLPPGVHLRPKLGFPVPLRAWLRGPLAGYVRDVVADAWPEQWLDRAAFGRMMEENQAGRADWSRAMYAVVTFALWRRAFAARAREGAAR